MFSKASKKYWELESRAQSLFSVYDSKGQIYRFLLKTTAWWRPVQTRLVTSQSSDHELEFFSLSPLLSPPFSNAAAFVPFLRARWCLAEWRGLIIVVWFHKTKTKIKKRSPPCNQAKSTTSLADWKKVVVRTIVLAFSSGRKMHHFRIV